MRRFSSLRRPLVQSTNVLRLKTRSTLLFRTSLAASTFHTASSWLNSINTKQHVDFSAAPFSEEILKARVAKYVLPDQNSETKPVLNQEETENLLKAILLTLNEVSQHLSDYELLVKQRELLKQVLDNADFRLSPEVLRSVFLELVRNKNYRFATETVMSSTPGAKLGPTEIKQRQQETQQGEGQEVENQKKITELVSTSDIVLDLCNAYNAKYGTNPILAKAHGVPQAIPIPVIMIPFRRCVYNGELDKAFELIDVSAGSRAYMNEVRASWIKYLSRWAGGTTSILVGVHVLLESGLVGTWASTTGVLSMVFTYLCSMSILGSLAFAGRVSGSGEYIKWLPGTPTTYWYSHAQEMKMASLIASVDIALPENQNEASFRVKKLLQARRMMALEPEQEILIKEYWARGGEGFEWIEPDQDPAEIIWRAKMEDSKAKRIAAQEKYGERYKWTDEVINSSKSLPHASLTDIPPPPMPPAPKGLPEL